MAHTNNGLCCLALLALFGAAPLAAQKPAPPQQRAPEPKLVFDREIFSYPGQGRRDPFRPLIGKESQGPLFEDLKLRGIIWSPDANRSVVLFQDGSGRSYRVHRGQLVGTSRVVEINRLSVRLAVENFGTLRYETLELRRGSAALRTGTQAAEATEAAEQTAEGEVSSEEAERLRRAAVKRQVDSIAAARRLGAPKQTNNVNEDGTWPFDGEARR